MFRRLTSRLSIFANRRPARRPTTSRPSPPAEFLESRTLLTVYTVNTLADTLAADGKISLREAILAEIIDPEVRAIIDRAGVIGSVDQVSDNVDALANPARVMTLRALYA